MDVFYYEVGKPPIVLSILERVEDVRHIVGGKHKLVPLANGCVIVCHHKQPVGKPRSREVNRVVSLPNMYDGNMVGVKHCSICGNFFVCTVSDGKLNDLPYNKISEVKALCGK